jgi:8-oxo-dGTP pyrophosphatase MutT (NUDIX family)
VTASEVVYENRWMRVREDRLERADGSPGLYSVVEKRPAAVVLPLHDDDSVTLVEQYRHPVGARSWELPQGALDGEADETSAEEIARTELAEETGLRAAGLRHLSRLYFAAGISSQYFDAWLATGLTQGDQSLEAEEEGLRVDRFPLPEVERMAREGEIVDAATVAVLGLLRGVRPD